MPAALHLMRLKEFPNLGEGAKLETTFQLGLAMPNDEATDNEAHTSIERLGRASLDVFDKYLGTHEDLEELTGRFRGNAFRQIIIERRFDLFVERDGKIVLGKGKKDVLFPALKRLRDAKKCNIEPVELDLGKLRSGLKTQGALIHGAHFNKLTLARVAAAAVFGDNVDQSEEFQHYDLAGNNSAVIISVLVKGVSEKFMITKGGVVVVYSNKDEKDLLDFGQGVADLTQFAQVQETGQ